MKKIIFASLILGLFLMTLSSAYHYGQSETWRYNEDIQGENRGFSLTHFSTGPAYHKCGDFNSFRYADCDDSASYNSYNDYRYPRPVAFDRSRGMASSNSRNTQQDHVGSAFATFQGDSQLQLRNEAENTRLRYSYGYANFYNNYYTRYYW